MEEENNQPSEEKKEMPEEKEVKQKKVEVSKEESNESNFTEKIRENPFIAATIILGVLLLIVSITGFKGITGGAVITGNVVSETDAGQALLDFANAQGANAELVSIKEDGEFYLVTLSLQGQEAPIYVTKDGQFLVQGLTPLTVTRSPEETQPTEVTKSDKPTAELFIWSYCPYGVTALEPFAQVSSLLGNSADFKVQLYYAGHGDFEVQQNKIQACIQKLGYEQYWDYAKTFANEIYTKCSGNIACDLTESTTLMNSLGINSNKVLTCVESEGDALLDEHSNAAKESGVSGSPTLVINGAKVNTARTAEAYKTAICSAFNDAPEECSTTLDSTGTQASGNC